MRNAPCFVLLAGVLAAACGDSSNPSSPSTPATPTVTSLAITGGFDAFPTGFFVDYIATASFSDGTSRAVTAVWTSSNSNVASVDQNGRLSAFSRGATTLSATYQSRSASKAVSIVDYYGGAWSGTYVMQKCDQSGVFVTVGWCRGLGGVGAMLPITLALQQGGNGASQITGTASLGSLAGNISGNVTGDGRLVIGGTYTVTSSGISIQITFGGWDTQLASSTQMRGGWANSVVAVGATGNAYMENQLTTMSQTSRTAAVARWSGTKPSGSAIAPTEYQLSSFSEMFSRFTRR